MAEEHTSQDPAPADAPSWGARLANYGLLAAVFVAATAVTWFLLRNPMGPLDRAVGVIAAAEPEPDMATAEGVPVPLPTRLQLGRKGLVSIALDARRGGYSRQELEPVLANMLKLSESGARCAVTALGLAEPLHAPTEGHIRIAREAVSWAEARAQLTGESGLSAEQAESVRGVICRRAVEGAFDSEENLEAARTMLMQYGEMVPGQAEGLLVMAAAMRLAGAGREACEPLERLQGTRPVVAARISRAAGCETDSEGK